MLKSASFRRILMQALWNQLPLFSLFRVFRPAQTYTHISVFQWNILTFFTRPPLNCVPQNKLKPRSVAKCCKQLHVRTSLPPQNESKSSTVVILRPLAGAMGAWISNTFNLFVVENRWKRFRVSDVLKAKSCRASLKDTNSEFLGFRLLKP